MTEAFVADSLLRTSTLIRRMFYNYTPGHPPRSGATCPHPACRQWSAGPCTTNMAFLAPPEWGDESC